VPRPVTGTYLVSDDGVWEGKETFQYSHALITIQLNNLVSTVSDWNNYVGGLEYYLSLWVSSVSVNQNLAWNLLLLMEQRNSLNVYGYSQVVSFTAVPSVVFDAETIYMSMASRDAGPCPIYTYPDFSRQDALLSAAFDLDGLTNFCNGTVTIGFTEQADNNTVYLSNHFKFDMNSFSTAAAINMGLADTSILEQMLFPPALADLVTFAYADNATNTTKRYVLQQLINPVHEGMYPIYCINDLDANEFLVCLLRQGYIFYLPVFNHMGGANASMYGDPNYCDCETGVGYETNCQQMDLLASFLFNRHYVTDLSRFYENLEPLIGLLLRYNNTLFDMDPTQRRLFYRYLVRDTYEASLFTIRGEGSTVGQNFGASQHQTPDSRNSSELFEFCGFDCSLLAARFWDIGNVAISAYSYNLYFGSCGPIINLSRWDDVVASPPTHLEESYYRCTQLPLISLNNALGISSGIVSLLLTVISVLLVLAIFVHARQTLREKGCKELSNANDLKEEIDWMSRKKSGEVNVTFGIELADCLNDHHADGSVDCCSQHEIQQDAHDGHAVAGYATESDFNFQALNQPEDSFNGLHASPLTMEGTLKTFLNHLHSARVELNEGRTVDPENPMHAFAQKLFRGK
jgi:hypothetical protein